MFLWTVKLRNDVFRRHAQEWQINGLHAEYRFAWRAPVSFGVFHSSPRPPARQIAHHDSRRAVSGTFVQSRPATTAPLWVFWRCSAGRRSIPCGTSSDDELCKKNDYLHMKRKFKLYASVEKRGANFCTLKNWTLNLTPPPPPGPSNQLIQTHPSSSSVSSLQRKHL